MACVNHHSCIQLLMHYWVIFLDVSLALSVNLYIMRMDFSPFIITAILPVKVIDGRETPLY